MSRLSQIWTAGPKEIHTFGRRSGRSEIHWQTGYAQFEIGPDVTTEVDHGMGGAAPCPTRQDFTAVVLAFVLPDMTSEMANLLPTL